MALSDDDRERVRVLWRDLCGAPEAFRRPGLEVVEAAGIRSAPPGAVSIVALGDAVAVCGPGVSAHRDRLARLAAIGVEALVTQAQVERVLGPFAMTLGPAQLWYGRVSATPRHDVVGPTPVDHALVAALVADASEDDVDESSIIDAPSGVYVAVDEDGNAAAGCGWHEWPHGVAHVGVLTATACRGRGYATAAAVAALGAASSAGLLPQWRAAVWNEPSIAVARRLGLVRVGTQFSVLPA